MQMEEKCQSPAAIKFILNGIPPISINNDFISFAPNILIGKSMTVYCLEAEPIRLRPDRSPIFKI
jgi:hypothetical protein